MLGWSHPALSSSGGLIGGICGGIVVTRWIGIRPIFIADLFAVPILVAFAVGRIGCFLNGDDYGIPVGAGTHFLGVVFPSLADGVSRHPVQIYESVACLVAAITISGIPYLSPLSESTIYRHPGRAAGAAMVCYGLIRCFIEGIRADWRGPILSLGSHMSVTPPRLVVLLGMIIGIYVLVGSRRARE